MRSLARIALVALVALVAADGEDVAFTEGKAALHDLKKRWS